MTNEVWTTKWIDRNDYAETERHLKTPTEQQRVRHTTGHVRSKLLSLKGDGKFALDLKANLTSRETWKANQQKEEKNAA